MKVFKIEVDWFDAASWKHRTVEIVAQSRIQLIKAFLRETQWTEQKEGESLKDAQKRIWNKHKKYLEEDTLKFPIIRNIF